MTPFGVTDKIKGVIEIPCGKCPSCADRRLSGWAFRLGEEYKIAESANFLTITYNNKHQPHDDCGFPTLVKKDMQNFMKRLRGLHPPRKFDEDGNSLNSIKYYTVGEYGGLSSRPHYHIIMFNHDIKLIQDAWSLDGKDIGHIHYGTVQPSSIIYSLKYMTKPSIIPSWPGDERQPEFSLFSKGLGSSYLTDPMVQWHKNDLENRMYIPIEDGKKIAMPRYFKQKIYSENERKTIGFAAKRKADKESQSIDALFSDDLRRAERDNLFHAQQQSILAAFKKQRHKDIKKNLV